MKPEYALPEKYKQYEKLKDPQVDYAVIKKFILKLKLLKFSEDEYFYSSIYKFYQECIPMNEELSVFLKQYNKAIRIKEILAPNSIKRYSKTFRSHLQKKHFKKMVSFKPQMDLIHKIQCEHNELLVKGQRAFQTNNFEQMKKVLQKLSKIPYEMTEEPLPSIYDLIVKKSNRVNILQRFMKKQNPAEEEQVPTKDGASNLSKILGILVQNLRDNPRTLTADEVEKQLQKICSEGNCQQADFDHISSLLENCRLLTYKYDSIACKFKKDELFSSEEIKAVKTMMKEYQKQPIRVQAIEEISTQYKQYERMVSPCTGYAERVVISQSIAKSFSSCIGPRQKSKQSGCHRAPEIKLKANLKNTYSNLSKF